VFRGGITLKNPVVTQTAVVLPVLLSINSSEVANEGLLENWYSKNPKASIRQIVLSFPRQDARGLRDGSYPLLTGPSSTVSAIVNSTRSIQCWFRIVPMGSSITA